jgi:hypothetical protein
MYPLKKRIRNPESRSGQFGEEKLLSPLPEKNYAPSFLYFAA